MRLHEDDCGIPCLRGGLLHSWVAVGVAVVGGVATYSGQKSANKANAKNAKNAGMVDVTTTRRADPATDPYRQQALDAAWNALTPQGATGGGPAGATSAGAARPVAPAGMRYNRQGKLVMPKNPATPSGGVTSGPAAPAARKFDGMSQETDDIRKSMTTELPAANKPLYNAGEGYIQDTLEGNSRNPLLGRATSAADAIAEDPRLAAFQDYLMGEVTGRGGSGGGGRTGTGGSGQGGSNVRYSYSANASGGAPGTGGSGQMGATATGADAALKKLVAGEVPAGWDDMEAAISRKVNEGRAANIRDLRARAVGSGFYGGSVYSDLESGAIAKGDQEMADSLGAARFGAFQNALGLGTTYDLGMEGIRSGERSANASAGAGARAQADALASQERMAKMGALGDMLGLGEQSRFGRAGALGDLAGLVSQDQRTGLAGISDITGGRRADLGAAGDLSLGADANRNARHASDNSLAGVRAGVNLGRSELGFAREQYYDPLSRLNTFTGVMGGLYGDYGSETTKGQDTRGGGAPAYSSPIGAAAAGAALGGQIGSQYKRKPAASSSAPMQNWFTGAGT